MPTAEPEVRSARSRARARALGRSARTAYGGFMMRVLKYALAGLVLSLLLTPLLGMPIVIVAAILRRDRRAA